MRSAILLVLGCLAVVALAGQTQAGVVNPGFEMGDLTGWTANDIAFVKVVSKYPNGPGTNYLAAEGSYFAILYAGLGPDLDTILFQTFDAAAGDRIRLAAFFDSNDYMPYNDSGSVSITDGTNTTVLGSWNVATVGNYQEGPWTNLPLLTGPPTEYVVPAAGQYTITAKVRNYGDNGLASVLGLDLAISNEVIYDTQVPEPASLAIWGMLGGLGLISARRSRKHVA